MYSSSSCRARRTHAVSSGWLRVSGGGARGGGAWVGARGGALGGAVGWGRLGTHTAPRTPIRPPPPLPSLAPEHQIQVVRALVDPHRHIVAQRVGVGAHARDWRERVCGVGGRVCGRAGACVPCLRKRTRKEGAAGGVAPAAHRARGRARRWTKPRLTRQQRPAPQTSWAGGRGAAPPPTAAGSPRPPASGGGVGGGQERAGGMGGCARLSDTR